MAKIDEYLKNLQTITCGEYVDVLFKILITPTAQQPKDKNAPQNASLQGPEAKLPNLYKFCFDVFDFGDKEFLCEHDIMRLVQLGTTDADASQNDEWQRISRMTDMESRYDYCVDH